MCLDVMGVTVEESTEELARQVSPFLNVESMTKLR